MSNVTVQKRGDCYQYKFEIAKVNGKRKFMNKSGFKTKAEAEREGIIAFNNYISTGQTFKETSISYSDLLDSWMNNHCYVNLKYHIFTEEEIQLILNRFKNNHCVYYAMLTAYYTGLRIAEVFALTWDDIDFENRTITVNKNILKKNQNGGTKQRHLSGNSTTVWYIGTCKTQSSYRTIPIGDTLLNAFKQFKKEQLEHQKNYGDSYMKHYKKSVINQYNNKTEIKIINAVNEISI